MTAPLTEAMRAVHAALTGDAPLMVMVQGVHSRVSDCEEFPYVSYFAVDTLEDDADCIDGSRHTLQIDIWSRSVSPAETWDIEHEVRRVLSDLEVDLPTHALAFVHFESARDVGDPDGLTHHRVLTFTMAVEAN